MKEFPYKLRLNMRALVRFEDETGQNLFSALGIDEKTLAKNRREVEEDNFGALDIKTQEAEEAIFDISRLRFSMIALIIWAGRLHETPSLTPEKNLDDIADLDPMEIVSAAGIAIAESMIDAHESANTKTPGKSKKTA